MKLNRLLVIIGVLVSILVFSSFFFLRQDDLIIHLISESKYPKIDFTLKVDGELVFNDSLQSSQYFNEKVVLEDFKIGFHELELSTKLGGVSHVEKKFFLFNKTVVVSFFDNSTKLEKPYIDIWYKFGRFLSD